MERRRSLGWWVTRWALDRLARVLVGDAVAESGFGRLEGQRCQELVDVFDHLVEAVCSLDVLGVVAQQVAVLLHADAAPRRGDDDRVNLGGKEGVYVAPGQVPGRIQVADVGIERSAADLGLGHNHVTAVARQDPNDGVHLGALHQRHDASGQQGHPRFLWAKSGSNLAPRLKRGRGDGGQGVFQLCQLARH